MQEKGYIRHYRTPFITCPYCGYEDKDSWEVDFGDGLEGDIDFGCGACGKQFRCSKHCEITYSTEKEPTNEPTD